MGPFTFREIQGANPVFVFPTAPFTFQEIQDKSVYHLPLRSRRIFNVSSTIFCKILPWNRLAHCIQ